MLSRIERHDGLKEVDREVREQDREDARHPLPHVRTEEAGERLTAVPERDVGGEGGEEPVDGAPASEKDTQRDREREHRAEEDGLRAEVLHGAGV